MGIEGFNAFFKEQCPEAYGFTPLASLRGRRIAVDAGNIGFRWYAGAVAQVLDNIDFVREEMQRRDVFRFWIQLCLSNIRTWMSFGVTPVLVFDGTAPAEKHQEQARRRELRMKTQQEIDTLRSTLTAMDFVDRLSEPVLRYKSLLKKVAAPSTEDKDEFRVVMETLGIPCVTSKGDGESLCSMLALDGVVHGVYSTDTDCLVYGCPCLITEISVVNKQTVAHTVRLDILLTKLGWTQQKFIDMCIMMSCDYNTNIPKIGPKRAFKLLQDHDSIDDLPAKLDKTPLNHVRCRELFSRKPSEQVVDHSKISRTLVRLVRAASQLDGQPSLVISSSDDTAETMTRTAAASDLVITSLSDLSGVDEQEAEELLFDRTKRLALASMSSNALAPPNKRRVVLTPTTRQAGVNPPSPHPELADDAATRRALHCLEIDIERFRLVANELFVKYECRGQFDSFLRTAANPMFTTPRSVEPVSTSVASGSASGSAASPT